MECFYCKSDVGMEGSELRHLPVEAPLLWVKAKSGKNNTTVELAAHDACYNLRPNESRTLSLEAVEMVSHAL